MSDQTLPPKTPAGPTNVGQFMVDLDGGTYESALSMALSTVAAAVVDQGHANGHSKKKGAVTTSFDFEHLPGTNQVRVTYQVKFTRPTSLGRATEETEGNSVLHVSRGGRLSAAQPGLFGTQGSLTS
jgi:hypothetical protein